VVEGILASVRRLRRFPESGRMLPERPRNDLREVIHGPYRVIYRLDPEQVVILTVRHSRIPISPDDPELE
jgi:plasmid stabilization system protein ParE